MRLNNLLPSLCLPPSKTRRAATIKAGTQQKSETERLVQVPGAGTYLTSCWRAHEHNQFSPTPAQIFTFALNFSRRSINNTNTVASKYIYKTQLIQIIVYSSFSIHNKKKMTVVDGE